MNEEVIEEGDGVYQAEDPIVVDISSHFTGEGLTQEHPAEQGDWIRDVDGAIAVTVGTEKLS